MRQPSSSREVRERDWEGKFTFNIVKSYCSHSLWRRVSLWGRRRRKNCKYTFHDDDSHERREWNETRGSIKSLLRRNVVLKWRSCNDLWFETQAWITRGRERNFYSLLSSFEEMREDGEKTQKSLTIPSLQLKRSLETVVVVAQNPLQWQTGEERKKENQMTENRKKWFPA